jgi:hypothetical protein
VGFEQEAEALVLELPADLPAPPEAVLAVATA